MLTGKTESGFEFEIEEKTLDDYEFIEAVGKCEQGDPLAYVKVVDVALGSKKEKAFEKIREKCGYVSAKEITKLIVEIFQTPKTKNSSALVPAPILSFLSFYIFFFAD